MDWRKNAGYIITDAMTVGESEIVLWVHESKLDMFVTWECTGKNNYYWGHYHNELLSAQKDYLKRALEKVKLYERMKKPKISEPER